MMPSKLRGVLFTLQEELTCEASNDALSEPVRNTITIQVQVGRVYVTILSSKYEIITKHVNKIIIIIKVILLYYTKKNGLICPFLLFPQILMAEKPT